MTRGQLPQRAGLPGLNGGGVAAAVPPKTGCRLATYLKFKVVVFTEQLKESKYWLHHEHITRQCLILLSVLVGEHFVGGQHGRRRQAVTRLHVHNALQVGKRLLCCQASILHLFTKIWREVRRLELGDCCKHSARLGTSSSRSDRQN